MERIILIETSTALCSVALAEQGEITAYMESSEPKAHASLTAVFVDTILKDKGLRLNDCDAVCVSEGPGSYTGLRVGVSTAKGLCFGANAAAALTTPQTLNAPQTPPALPLLSVGTLDTLVWQALCHPAPDAGVTDFIIPMIDARRMEVYTAIYNSEGDKLTDTEAHIVTEDSFAEYLDKGRVLFIGDGAEKCRGTLTHPNASFLQCHPKASAMLVPALKEYKEKRFKDIAYFEPFYLKDFVATVSKKSLF